MIWWLLLGVPVSIALMFFEVSALAWFVAIGLWLVIGYSSEVIGGAAAFLLTLVLLVPALILATGPLRRKLVTGHLLTLFRRILPKMSSTERDALEAGTTWWDADLFSGKPDWNRLLGFARPALTTSEQAFLTNEVEELCEMVNDWEVTQVWQDLPPHVWQFVKDRGFLGMIIPEKYGGREFSATMHSQVIMKLATRSSALAVSVMVPNSLGPAELLLRYGSDEQKQHYLPRLAAGLDVPCFALTSPYAGSDAAAIPDTGVVCKGIHDGRLVLGLRLTWDKRYITLGPIATVLGLAVRTIDPEGLLGTSPELGISCVLIPTSHNGVVIGRRHWPLNAVFQNGPTSGKDVFVPLEWVIGGAKEVGHGWRMLMECLAAGRAISLPSSNVGMAKHAVRGTSAYSAIRRQFRSAIGNFEGVQEALARMGANLYMMDATRRLSALAVDLGERPAVISAIAKYHVTERARLVINDAMDIVGGKGICMGPSNFLARAYQQMPISITVEGANILTRCLIIFGQGAIRCHPYVLKEMHAADEPDPARALSQFDHAFFSHTALLFGNFARSLVYGVSGGLLAPAPRDATEQTRAYYRDASRFSAGFALLTDLAMFSLGGELKRREGISARLGDVLSQLYMISATLKRFQDEGLRADHLAYLQWSVEEAFVRIQNAILGVLENFPNRVLAVLLRLVMFPLGMPYRYPSDELGGEVAHAMQAHGEGRERLLADSFVADSSHDPIACGEQALQLLAQVETIELRLKPAIRSGTMQPLPQALPEMQKWIARATAGGLISPVEQDTLLDFARLVELSVRVDDFSQDFDASADRSKRQHAEERRAVRAPVLAPSESTV